MQDFQTVHWISRRGCRLLIVNCYGSLVLNLVFVIQFYNWSIDQLCYLFVCQTKM